ncbi:CatB-related O-acetyltransferase [Thiopseudomonas denitrificans]|uniref:Acetyltransferase-like isoleucine patch superfamily enzyme n=1 Tax=Thiopseudomonas denitrificans TaxID=1501432 RepID=A0A4R6TV94_9GAMM|nr:CatB-related O-acetyltransferase [Thiopseudomonas denitrificans]TDQ34754.1 acetyltransferase-like isoleucine patch superfamily enzyme [Thiopseudomonas denitrificans]
MGFWQKFRDKQVRKKIRKLPRVERGVARFAHAYADRGYIYGYGSYGLPIVHDWNEGSRLQIGRFCSIAEDVHIFLGGHHRADWVSTFPFPAFYPRHAGIENYAVSRGDVVIGNDVWLCTGAKILSGVKVGDGAIIGAYAVVTKDVEPYSVVAGNPARLVRHRFSQIECDKLQEIGWWNWDAARIEQAIPLLCSDDLGRFFEFAAQQG